MPESSLFHYSVKLSPSWTCHDRMCQQLLLSTKLLMTHNTHERLIHDNNWTLMQFLITHGQLKVVTQETCVWFIIKLFIICLQLADKRLNIKLLAACCWCDVACYFWLDIRTVRKHGGRNVMTQNTGVWLDNRQLISMHSKFF